MEIVITEEERKIMEAFWEEVNRKPTREEKRLHKELFKPEQEEQSQNSKKRQ